jgi:hypothetical protein
VGSSPSSPEIYSPRGLDRWCYRKALFPPNDFGPPSQVSNKTISGQCSPGLTTFIVRGLRQAYLRNGAEGLLQGRTSDITAFHSGLRITVVIIVKCCSCFSGDITVDVIPPVYIGSSSARRKVTFVLSTSRPCSLPFSMSPVLAVTPSSSRTTT